MKKQTAKRQGEEEMTLFVLKYESTSPPGMEAEIQLGKKNQLRKMGTLHIL